MDITEDIQKLCKAYLPMLEEDHDPTTIYVSLGVYIYHEAKKRLPDDEGFRELMQGVKDTFFEGKAPELEPDGSQAAALLKGFARKIVLEYERLLHHGDS